MRFLIVFFVIVANISWAQTDFKIEVFGGADNSLLKPLEVGKTFSSTVTGFVGFDYIFDFKDGSDIRVGTFVGQKRSIDEASLKYNNTYISLFSNFYIPLSENFKMNIGPQYSILMNSYTLKGNKENQLDGYENYLAFNVGFDYQLQKNLNIGIIYEAPLNQSQLSSWPNIKFKLGITIDKDFLVLKKQRTVYKQMDTKVKQLKNTALLVRLRGYKKQIAAYNERGQVAMAKKMEQKRDFENKEIINAFINEFDFCPVYFFYNYDTKKVKAKDFSKVLVNSSLEVDSNIQFDLDTFLIGELGYSELDKSSIHYGPDHQKNNIGGEHNAQRQTDFSNYGFTIKDQDFYPLAKPFPRHVNGYFIAIKKSPDRIIRRLNRKLYDWKENYFKHLLLNDDRYYSLPNL